MNINDLNVATFLRHARVARIATLSKNGRPSITPLYFIVQAGKVWLGTADWTLAARDVKADARVSVLFALERTPQDRRILRITGQAQVRTDAEAQRIYVQHVIFRYNLSPGGILNMIKHFHLLGVQRRYYQQSIHKGLPCVIEVHPDQLEFLV